MSLAWQGEPGMAGQACCSSPAGPALLLNSCLSTATCQQVCDKLTLPGQQVFRHTGAPCPACLFSNAASLHPSGFHTPWLTMVHAILVPSQCTALLCRWCVENRGFPADKIVEGPLNFFIFAVTIVVVAVPEVRTGLQSLSSPDRDHIICDAVACAAYLDPACSAGPERGMDITRRPPEGPATMY